MPFSIQAVQELTDYSRTAKVHLIVILDRNANIETAKKIIEDHKWPTVYSKKFDSVELTYRKIENHYPTTVFFKAGKIIDYIIPGLKSAKAYQKEFEAIK